MPAFLESVEQQFSTRDLYKVLEVEKTASDSALKKAYHRLSLKVHPDRVEPEEVAEATQKFQVLCKVYSILTDKDKRAIYDEDGTVDEEDSSIFKQDRDWLSYWRLLFPKLTVNHIVQFEKEYKGSEEEMEALKSVYIKSEGDMDMIMESDILCLSMDDEPRFRKVITGWIREGVVPDFPAFTNESERKRRKRKRRFEDEAEEAEEMKRERGERETNGDDNSLSALIRARQKSREEEMDGFFDSLEEKYAKKSTKTKGKTKSQGKKTSAKKGKK